MPTDLRLDAFCDLLKLLIRTPSVVGAEWPFFRVLERELVERGAKVTAYQGLLVAQGTDPRSAMFSAHVDRHGLVATGPGEFEYAAFIAQNRGEQSGDSISEQTVQKVAGRFVGERVHAYEPWSGSYLGQATITASSMPEGRDNLVFRLDGLGWLPPGSPVAYLDRLDIHDGLVEAQLDNVLGVAVLVHLFELGFQGTALFSAQEEIGRSWRFVLEWFRRERLETDRLLVVDTSPFPDLAAAREQDLVLRNADATAQFCGPTIQRSRELCERLGIRTCFKDEWIVADNLKRVAIGKPPRSLGRTELGRLIAGSAGRVTGTTLQVPTFDYHTTHETASLHSIEAMLAFLDAWSRGD